MPSIVPGFEYDIFISYRQKDNKGDHWVTEFVNVLKTELEATFKEDISIYFDENPHDGLLETHDVDDSLKEKLKCLIFIPIISQTYCDPKSFAWKNEFLAFKKLATEDELGLKIKLQNGNVASRTLPIKIHELDENDKSIIENEIGPLRAIDFIFKSAGVNRPLRAHEEHPHDNLNKTFYRDQMNKVANAVKELITALQIPQTKVIATSNLLRPISASKRKKITIVAASLLLLGVISFSAFYFAGFKTKMVERNNSIAVLPFDNLSNDPEQEYFCDGTTEQVISSLARLKDLKVIARTSVLQYKKTTKTIAQIGKELNVTHVLESSVRKSGNQIRITAQLIAVKDETHLWAEDFDNKVVADIFQIQDAVATKIAASLKNKLLPEEKEKLKSEKPSNPEAYEHYLKGEYIHGNYYVVKLINDDFLKAENEFKLAIQLDSNYATARAGLSNLYDSRSNFADLEKDRIEFRKLATRSAREAFRLNPKLPYSLLVQAQSWININKPNLDSAYKYFQLAYKASPNSGLMCSEFGGFYNNIGLFDNALTLFQRAKEIDPKWSYRYSALCLTYFLKGNTELAEENARTALDLDPNNIETCAILMVINCYRKNFVEAERLLRKIKKINPDRDFSYLDARILAEKGDKEKALNLFKTMDAEIYVILKMKPEALKALEKKNRFNYLEFKNFHFYFLRDDPRFEKIVQQAKILYEERLKKYGRIELPNN